MRVSYNGNTFGFQPNDARSIRVTRTKLIQMARWCQSSILLS
jgi:hypothetical protein